MYRRVIKPVLFSLTIEQAHHAVLLLLRIIGLIPGGRWLLRKCYAVEHPALEREVFGIRFANPFGLAAGFDHNGEAIRELAALGFGFDLSLEVIDLDLELPQDGLDHVAVG